MILAYIYFGSCLWMSPHSSQGALAAIYGVSSMFGYFGSGEAPLAKLARVNGIAVLGASTGLATVVTGYGSGMLMLLTMLYLIDSFQGLITDSYREEDDYEIIPPSSED